MDELSQQLLGLLASEGTQSAARVAKKLGLAQSQLRRLLTLLGDNAALGGLGLVNVDEDGERLLLSLTVSGHAACDPPLPGTTRGVDALRIDASLREPSRETVAEECPVALVYNGISHAVMMATPADLEDFARGFSLTEGIVAQASELLDIEAIAGDTGISLHITIAEARFQALKNRRRTLTGRTGCGLCGTDALEQAIRPLPQVSTELQVSAASLQAGFAKLADTQILNRATGAVHAAALLSSADFLLREDVGRHNALDKLIGAAAHAKMAPGVLLITSRASYEMVAKAAAANCPVLAAISAPTALAIELAQQAGISLIGFAREQRLTVFTHPQRLTS